MSLKLNKQCYIGGKKVTLNLHFQVRKCSLRIGVLQKLSHHSTQHWAVHSLVYQWTVQGAGCRCTAPALPLCSFTSIRVSSVHPGCETANLSRIILKQFIFVCIFNFLKWILTEFASFQPFGILKSNLISQPHLFSNILSHIMLHILYFFSSY